MHPAPLSRTQMLALLLFAVGVMLLTVLCFGIAHVDTGSYIGQIGYYRHFDFATGDAYAGFRGFKPFYGVAGIALPFLSPEAVLITVNGIFFIGVIFLSYLVLRELGFSKREQALGTFWIGAGYPAILYGFAYGTDVSGWFFTLATILAVLIAVRSERWRLLPLASFLGFLGAGSKETGALGLLFGGLYILFHLRSWGFAKTLKAGLLLSVPFLLLEGALLYAIHYAGLPTFFGWLSWNNNQFADVHTLKFFVGAELATFNALWLPVAIGAYVLVRKKLVLPFEGYAALSSLGIAALPVIAWPFFTDRILYIEFIFVVPLALHGARNLLEQLPARRRLILCLLVLLPLMGSVLMASIGGHDGLYRFAHFLLRY